MQIVSSNEDEYLARLIPSVSQLVKNYCGRDFVDYFSTDKTEVFDIEGSTVRKIFLKELPVLSVTSVKERTSFSGSWTDLYDDGTNGSYDYYVEKPTGIITRVSDSAKACWPEGVARVEVVYKGGYDTLPADLELGVFDIIKYYHKKEATPRKTAQGTTKESTSTASKDGQASFPDHITRILDLYKI